MKPTGGIHAALIALFVLFTLLAVAGCSSARPATDPVSVAAENGEPRDATGEDSRTELPHGAPRDPAQVAADADSDAAVGEHWVEVFPHVRIDVARGLVEFEGQVPIDPHDPQTPHLFLEVVVCPWDTKEHEALVATHAKPSHVHAALLMLGAIPGQPGTWRWDPESGRMSAVPPEGSPVPVSLRYVDGTGRPVEADPAEWIIDVRERRSLRARAGHDAGWVFAGSSLAPRPDGPGGYYKADVEGTLIGLATFGVEAVAWNRVFSPEAAVSAPEWIADPAKLPPYRSKITVRLGPVGVDRIGTHPPRP